MRTTKDLKILSLLACILITIGCGSKTSNAGDEDGSAYVDTLAENHPEYLPEIPLDTIAPDFEAPDTAGVKVKLSDFKGKYVVVDFYASWCPDCRQEAPELKKVYDEISEKGILGKDVAFLGYSFDRDMEAWKKYLGKEEMPWPQVSTLQPMWHDIKVAQDYAIHWIPAFLVVSPDGKIAAKAITAQGLRQEIKNLSGK